MFKLIISTFLFMNLSYASQESRLVRNNRMNFRDFAKLSAISQCQLSEKKESVNEFAKQHGLALARANGLSVEEIAQEVSLILYELDQVFPEEIPEKICKIELNKFETYQKKIKNEIKG